MAVEQTKKQIFFKCLSFLYKVCIAANGVASFTNPVSAVITGIVTIASVISASVSDKNAVPVMKLINTVAINIDKAENNLEKNTY